MGKRGRATQDMVPPVRGRSSSWMPHASPPPPPLRAWHPHVQQVRTRHPGTTAPASQLCPGNGGHWYAPVPLNRSEVLKGGRLRSPLQQLRSARRHGLGKQLHQEPSILFFLTALPKGRASLHTQPGNTSAPKTAACQYVSSPTLTGTLCWQSSP